MEKEMYRRAFYYTQELETALAAHTVSFLVKHGSYTKEDLLDAFLNVIENGLLDGVKAFVEAGVNLCDNWLTIRSAVFSGHLDIVQYLVEMGADPCDVDRMAVTWALEEDYVDVVEFLISKGWLDDDNMEMVPYLSERGITIPAS